ncbi:MAG: Ig-like domain-containing protein [Bacteroidaceae bacterium]|nr:Ig-like domain-containing protein [Bacteroidaceae bacterium]
MKHKNTKEPRLRLCLLVACLMMLGGTAGLRAQSYSLYVGDEVMVYNPTPPQGSIDACTWTSNTAGCSTTQRANGCIISVDAYFSGVATVECYYNYSYYSSAAKSYVVSHGSAYYYVSAKPITMKLNAKEITLHPTQGYELTCTFSPEPKFSLDPFVEWSSTDESVATVTQSGYVRAKKGGKCTIIADGHTGNAPQQCTVTVTEVPPTGVSLSGDVTLNVGESKSITAKVTPTYATTSLTWSSSRPAVATVSSTGQVKAVASGTAVITVRTGNGLSATSQVTVRPEPTRINVSPSTLRLKMGESATLSHSLYPTNAGTTSLTWSTSDGIVATVTDQGVVKAVASGTADISITAANGVSGKCRVTVPTPQYVFLVWMKNGEKLVYSTNDKPRVQMGAQTVTVSSSRGALEYAGEQVLKFTMQDADLPIPDGIRPVQAAGPAVPHMDYGGDRVDLSGCRAGGPVAVYDLQGHLLMRRTADAEGRLSLSLSELNRGIYLIKTENNTYKIHKK